MSEVKKVAQCVEAFCISGCEDVRSAITSLQNHDPIQLHEQLVNELDEQERAALLEELVKIMAVYEERPC